MSRRAIFTHMAVLTAIGSQPVPADVLADDPDPIESITRQQRRALERAGAYVIECHRDTEFWPDRFDLRTQGDRTHPSNPKKKGRK